MSRKHTQRSAGRLYALLGAALGLGLLLASGGCGDNRPGRPGPKPDAGIKLDACDPTIDRMCSP